MGLLFKRKSSSGNIINTKRIAGTDLSKSLINKVGSKLSFSATGARGKFKKIFDSGKGINREEVHEGLQEMIGEGYLTKNKASQIAKEVGLTEKEYRRFEGLSEMDRQKRQQEKTSSSKLASTDKIKKEKEISNDKNGSVAKTEEKGGRNPIKSLAPTSSYDQVQPPTNSSSSRDSSSPSGSSGKWSALVKLQHPDLSDK